MSLEQLKQYGISWSTYWLKNCKLKSKVILEALKEISNKNLSDMLLNLVHFVECFVKMYI